tara:strand:+ start:6088 stop:6468 length:381 start_codon:yes stop_codon:yes gene_type:complete
MNLYKILFSHTAPKGSGKGIKGYLLAENDEQVYDYIDKKYNYESWKDCNEDEDRELDEIYDKDYNLVGTETFKEKILRIKGQMNDEDYDYSDAYYGITLLGWEVVEENTTKDFTEMIELGVVTNCI